MTTHTAAPPLSVLLVEDSAPDVEITADAFEDAGLAVELTVAKNGHIALELLRAATGADGQMPQLVLLDLNLPKVGGLQVLEFIRAQPALQALPVVVMTSSRSPADLDRAAALQAVEIIHKPITPAQVLQLVEAIAGGAAPA